MSAMKEGDEKSLIDAAFMEFAGVLHFEAWSFVVFCFFRLLCLLFLRRMLF